MKTLEDILRDADPLRHEPPRMETERDRMRQRIAAAASDAAAPASVWRTLSLPPWAAAVLIVIGILAVGARVWLPSGATLQAAIRFEVRLAEDRPGEGLRETRIAGSDRVIYVHGSVVVSNGDIRESRVVPVDGGSRFDVAVEFTDAGARKMRLATEKHVGRPLAILLDGELVAAPVVRSPIGESAVLTGDRTRAEAQRIVDGIVPR